MNLSKYIVWGLIIAYIVVIIYNTLYNRNVMIHYKYDLIPFWSYAAIIKGQHQLIYLNLMNILMFVPLGCMMRFICSKVKLSYIAVFAGCLSLCIEIIQLVTKRGTFEFDDVIHNVLGCMIGIVSFDFIMIKLKERKNEKSINT